ncbi:MAG: AAC(3) family N-acetyltransferase [Ruminococcus sp.]|nr:AAC(3) family N-acetyltransferase [Ruminococcus sp.]
MRFSHAIELTEEDKNMGITTKIKILSENAERTGMGIIESTFRRRADVFTGEGVIRTSGWGKYATEASKG